MSVGRMANWNACNQVQRAATSLQGRQTGGTVARAAHGGGRGWVFESPPSAL